LLGTAYMIYIFMLAKLSNPPCAITIQNVTKNYKFIEREPGGSG